MLLFKSSKNIILVKRPEQNSVVDTAMTMWFCKAIQHGTVLTKKRALSIMSIYRRKTLAEPVKVSDTDSSVASHS